MRGEESFEILYEASKESVMAILQISSLDPMNDVGSKKPAAPLRLSQTVKDDVSLNALLEAPVVKHMHRNPLEWAGAMALHIAILAALIIIPLYTTGTIRLNPYEVTPLIAPPLAPPPPPAPAAGAVAPHAVHPRAKITYKVQKLAPPTSIPRKVSSETAAESAPDLGGLAGGVPGGISGGQIGGAIGGIAGGTGTALPPPPPPQTRSTPKIVRVGSNLKAPRQTFNVDPVYPPLARQTHVWGTVVVDAVIDEHGNVAQARVVSGHPLLVDAALKAVLQWKYAPTSLNGQPISVELQVQVHFNLGGS
jgi:protein TonB